MTIARSWMVAVCCVTVAGSANLGGAEEALLAAWCGQQGSRHSGDVSHGGLGVWGVSVPWVDASAQDVLEKIVLPLEEELTTVRVLDRMFSFSSTGFGRVFLNFKSGTDMDVAYRELRDRIERTRPGCPRTPIASTSGRKTSRAFPSS